jgi:hypothetical protein
LDIKLKEIDLYKTMSKKDRGQFYTSNHAYILEGFDKPSSKVIEPFAGKGDLLDWLNHDKWVAYDIDPKRDDIEQRDTLLHPPCYKDSYIITNPPYLARNKCSSKALFDKYTTNDLYKCFINSLVQQEHGCLGGIFIIPAGFFLSPRDIDTKCRDAFMSKYRITKVKYFEETVFPDTPTTVVAFSFVKSDVPLTSQYVVWEQRPSGTCKTFEMKRDNRWIIGGDVYNLKTNPDVKISRFVKDRKCENLTNLTLCALDSGTEVGRIHLKYEKDYVYQGIDTSRTFATLCIAGVKLSEDEQIQISKQFNEFLESRRRRDWSLFLPQYRESKEYARKRIPFDLAYKIVSNLLLSHSK